MDEEVPEEKVVLSEGLRALSFALRKRGMTSADLARELGCRPSMVSRWRRGRRKPGRKWASLLERSTGVPARLWDQPPSGPVPPETA